VKVCWNLSKSFSASFEMIMWFLFLLLLVYICMTFVITSLVLHGEGWSVGNLIHLEISPLFFFEHCLFSQRRKDMTV
jgi:hypothetical protein